MKCSLCNAKIQETFLKKLLGTYIKKSGKLHPICQECQKSKSISAIKEAL